MVSRVSISLGTACRILDHEHLEHRLKVEQVHHMLRGDANPLAEVGHLASALIVAAQSAAPAASAQQVLSQQLMSQFATTATTTSSPSSSPSAASKFANASKMVGMPDPSTAVGPEAEQSPWIDFSSIFSHGLEPQTQK